MRSARALLAAALIPGIAAFAAGRGPQPLAAVSQKRPTAEVIDLSGQVMKLFEPTGPAAVMFFVATDCPISNSYAPEIQSICREYGSRGVACSLIYEDVDLSPSGRLLDDAVRKHLAEYGYAKIPAVIDRTRTVAKRAKASVTPQAVVVDRAGKIRYRGRIDNLYAALGTTRRQVTEHDLRSALGAVLAGRPVPKTETESLGCYIVDPTEMKR
jgi:thiol-disulfide isomerase/thioredoxin